MKCFIFLILASLLSIPAAAQTPQAVVTVNGTAILQSDVIQRLWNINGAAVLDTMVDETLMRQEADRLKAVPSEKDIDARLGRIKKQFADDKAFEEQLKKSGATVDTIKNQIRLQLVTEITVAKAKDITVTKDEVKSFFEQNKEKLATPESVQIRHIMVKNKQEADDILIALEAGADFAKLASQKSLDEATKIKGGDMGFVSRGILTPEVEKVVFSLKKGQHTPVISSSAGFHVIKAEDIRASEPADFKKIQDDLNQSIYSAKISQALPELLKELRAKAKIEYPAAQQPAK